MRSSGIFWEESLYIGSILTIKNKKKKTQVPNANKLNSLRLMKHLYKLLNLLMKRTAMKLLFNSF